MQILPLEINSKLNKISFQLNILFFSSSELNRLINIENEINLHLTLLSSTQGNNNLSR